MRRFTLSALVTGVLLGIGGCYGTGTYATVDPGYGYYGDYGGYGDYGPELAYLSPGVQVVAGYDYPVFYSNNFYWRYHDDRWYRSPYYNRGWVYATPPRAIARIDRPYQYRNYRPYGYTTRRNYRDYRGIDRDDRRYRAPSYRYRGSDNRHRAPSYRYRGSDNRYRGSDNRYRGSDYRYRGSDNRYRGSDNRYRGSDNRYRGSSDRSRGVRTAPNRGYRQPALQGRPAPSRANRPAPSGGGYRMGTPVQRGGGTRSTPRSR